MPFTLAHPAAVLALARGPLVPAALVAGSLSPDVPYFVPVPRSADAWYEPLVNATTTHTWPGMLLVAVPTAAGLLGLWWLVRAPLRTLIAGEGAPQAGYVRSSVTAPRVLWGILSLALGVLTHVAWDSFTHGDGVVMQHVAWLREPLVGAVPAGRVLQHLSTAVGLAVLAAWALRASAAWRRGGGRLVLGHGRLAVAGALVMLGVLGAAVGGAGARGAGWEASLSAAAKNGGTAVLAAGLLAAASWWVTRLAPSGLRRVRQR